MIKRAWAVVRAALSAVGAGGRRVLSAVAAAAAALMAAAPALTRWRRPAGRRRRARGFTVRDGCLALPDGRLPAVADIASPVTLGVHRAASRSQPAAAAQAIAGGPGGTQGDYPGVAASPGVPAYVPRSFDGDLAERVAAGGFVLLVGDSAAGKTRAAFEAIRATVPGHTLICPAGRSAVATAAGLAARERWAVLWLDNLERYLGAGGLTADLAGRLLGSDGAEPVTEPGPGGQHLVIMATMGTAQQARLTAAATDDDAVPALCADARQLLAMAHTIPVGRMFTDDELDRVTARDWEPRLASAIGRAGSHGVAEHLAGGPEMVLLWERARAAAGGSEAAAERAAAELDSIRGAALVSAAVDIRRAGYVSPLPRALLEQVHVHYLGGPGSPDAAPGSLDGAWAWAIRRRLGGIALLRPAGPGVAEVFGYLVDAVQSRSGGFGGIPGPVLHAAIEAAGPADADSIAAAAYAEGRCDVAEQAWRRAWQAKEADTGLGPDHPDTLATRGDLALALRGAGRLDDAEAEHRAVVEAMTRVLGPDYPATLAGRGNLAGLLRAAGRLDDAEAEHRSVLKIMNRVLGRNHPDTLTCRANIASLLHAQGRLEQAEKEHRAVFKALARVLGPDHPDTLTSRNNLASVLHDMGRLEEAEAEHRAELEACSRVLGPDHPDTLISRANLGGVLRAMGRLQDAEAEYRAVAQAMARLHGPGHPQTVASRSDLAAVLRSLGRLEEAEAEYRAVLDGASAMLGPDHRATLAARASLGLVLYARGRLAEAEAEHRAITEIMNEVLGPDDPDTLASRGNLALALRSLGRLDEAEAEQRAVLESRLRVLGPDHPDTLTSRSSLAGLAHSRRRSRTGRGDDEQAPGLISVS